jgi:hypothetical protein
MTEMNVESLPLVVTFVADVRARLSDLPPEISEELTEGLEADLSELVAEHGGAGPLGEVSLVELVGDPTSYAEELRAAAGLPVGVVGRPRSTRLERFANYLDSLHPTWERAVTASPLRTRFWELIVVARPVWWVLRAWTAVHLMGLGASSGVIPRVLGSSPLGALLLVVASILSIEIGRGKLWPRKGKRGQRVVLLGLNSFAAVMTPIMLAVTSGGAYYYFVDNYAAGQPQWSAGLTNNGSEVCNIQPYDAQGNPLEGIQLFDQSGKPLNANCAWMSKRRPWMLGDVKRWNVFPQGSQRRTDPVPILPSPEVLRVPAVSPPGGLVDVPAVAEPTPSSVATPKPSIATSVIPTTTAKPNN